MGKESGSKVSQIELGVIIGLMLIIIFGENLYFLISQMKENYCKNNKDNSKDNSKDNNDCNFVW